MENKKMGHGQLTLGFFFLSILTVVVMLAGIFPSFANLIPPIITMDYMAPYYQPSTAIVDPHTPIHGINSTSSPHTIRHDGCLTGENCLFDTGLVLPEGRFSLPPLPPGNYSYHCELHPIMKGKIVVMNAK